MSLLDVCRTHWMKLLVAFFIICDINYLGRTGWMDILCTDLATQHQTVKLLMTDHSSRYIILPLVNWTDSLFNISLIPWLTANMVSLSHFVVAIIAAYFLSNEHLLHRRIGVGLMVLRSALDTLDGRVYRAKLGTTKYHSQINSLGYIIDGIADTSATIMMGLATLLSFMRRNKVKVHRVNLCGSDLCNGCLTSKGIPVEGRSLVGMFLLVALFSVAFVLRLILWDHFIRVFYGFFENPQRPLSKDLRSEHMYSGLGVFTWWLWSWNSSDAMLQYCLYTIFLDKVPVFLKLVVPLMVLAMGITALVSYSYQITLEASLPRVPLS